MIAGVSPRVAIALLAAGALAVALHAWFAPPVADTRATVFAAASLQDVVSQALDAAGLGDSTRVAFAASSTLARQIEAGAPADIYVSAHRAWMDYLDERGLLVSDTRRRFAGNRLVVVAAAGTSAVAGSLTDLPRWLGAGGRLAVGDPDHVPAGMYARAALRSAGLWTALEPRLARADSVRAALALVTTGSAPVALVYATDLGADAGRRSGLRVLATVDPALHPPIVYEIARLARPGPGRVAAGDAARRTGSTAAARQATVDAAWQALTTAPARAALARLGFATE